ncbi:cytochrome b5-like heme/steroid binding domain-containing protein [Globomyces pollinis-pini]|nr:cytochrome b5-like heme/steroid binding domain-containing protein [Globomyces pollinis-pini]KAJ2994913.1 hypothetical protein HDV02_001189 [Globomyces sp. JEL0801]KAJ2994921.1 hypothetical protein HDV02_001197 [Globomyces sp. JEL0801]
MTKSFTHEELLKYNGEDANQPVYVAIKGTVFDVSQSRETYTPPKGYSVFAGKEANKALGKSSLKVEDCVPDYSDLTPAEMKTLDDWVAFYTKKYPVVGEVKK